MRAQKDSQGIYVFDALVIEPRLARVGGEVVDVSTIPVAVSLALSKHADRSKEEIVALAEKDAEGELSKMVKLVSDVCVVSNPALTTEFLMKHLDYNKLSAFIKFVLQPMTDKAEEFVEADEKNAATDEAQSD